MSICKKCGKTHGMVLENRITGESEPLDICEDCLFAGCYIKHPTEKIILTADDPIDQPIANQLARLYKHLIQESEGQRGCDSSRQWSATMF